MGAVAGPFDAWLTLRGIKTLGVRMDRHCDNAERVAELPASGTRRWPQVLYPGLPSTPGHEVAAKQMRRFGGMVSLPGRRRRGGGDRGLRPGQAVHARRVARRRRVADRAPGPDDPRQSRPARRSRCPADLVRLSVGIETVDDLLADLGQALET